MKRLSAVLFVLLLVSLSNAQQRWTRTYGGANGDYGYSVQQTTDGGYIIAGSTTSFGAGYEDVYLIKTNASGDTLWTRTYGGTAMDVGCSVLQTTDGGFVIVGYTSSFGAGGLDVYLIKTNASGDTLWTRTYGGPNNDYGNSVHQTFEGGYIIAGSTLSFGAAGDVYLIKTNASGDTLWTKTYGGASLDYGNSVQQTLGGGFVIAGYTASFGVGGDVYLVKTNASGDTLWTRSYGGTGLDYGNSVQQTLGGGYIIAGYTYSFGQGLDDDAYLIKTNASGDSLWTRTYGGSHADWGNSVQQTFDGGYIIAGGTNSFSAGDNDVFLIKTNSSGNALWTGTFGGPGDDRGYSVQQTPDDGYIIAGVTTSFGAGSNDIYLIKTDANGNVGVEEERGQGDKGTRGQGVTVTPNPFTSFATLPGHEAERFSLYDISGRKVGTYRGDRVGEGLAPGVYFLKYQEMLKQVQHDEIVRIVKVR